MYQSESRKESILKAVKKNKEKKRKMGICVQCTKKSSPNHTLCDLCLEKMRIKNKNKKLSKLCLDCGDSVNAEIYCNSCKENRKLYKKKYRTNKKEKGVCIDCNSIAANGRWCQECFEKHKIKKQNLLNKGICVRCRIRQAEKGLQRCLTCHQYDKIRRSKFEQLDLCLRCGGNRTNKDKKYCEKCYLKNKAKKHLNTAQAWELLESIFIKQKGICPYTKKQLILFEAEVDHIIPISKGGKNEESNLQWAHKTANRMKGNLYHKEFIEFCKLIAQSN